ncbi:hypothetical protein [Sphingomicrobium lutaoense]|uniref:DUF4440 domain-containing protein n=1 Tax=Sphingomicrobium lutaoense TaxID=515949 RepID=A0A839Z245_9SPHN|nr:hypothetical protein [Sphingomicrobium lutaoense]MBB3764107.1 hypothetical protein [Sphingomicrobium lutaoense]
MIASLLIASMPPPAEGAYPYAILDTAKVVIEAVATGDAVTASALMEEDAQLIVVDEREAGQPRVRIRTMTALLDHLEPAPDHHEPLGMPKVLQDGGLAQVWVPYAFYVGGERRHCGTNNLTLVQRGMTWKVATISMTMVPPDRCADIAREER